jgi:hypothetical protein
VAARLCGEERDPAAAALAAAAVPEAAERVGDALAAGMIEEGGWDVVVGNPPYVRSVRLKADDPALWARLRGTLAATSHGEWDLYAAFIERALAWAAPGGEIGLVVPSRWLTARSAARLRAALAARRAVRRVVDFGAHQVMDGPTTYTCLLFMSVAGSASVGVERGQRRGRVAWSGLGEAPWVLPLRDEAAALERGRRVGPALATCARIAKGAGSNADGVFLLERDASAGHGEAVRVPCVRGRDVTAFALLHTRDALLPYVDGVLVPWPALRRSAPTAAAHLLARRDELEARERRRFAGAEFHRWGRPQNLRWLRDRAPKVVVPDATHEGRAALDTEGRLVMDTAYALRPLDDRVPIGLLLAVLNSPIVGLWLRATGIPLRGGYFRMKTATLASLPVPDPSTRAARRIAAQALELDAVDAPARRALEGAVMRLYGGCPEGASSG